MYQPLFTNDAVVLGILMVVLAFIFKTSSSGQAGWKKFYTYVPALLLCYFIPALLHYPLGLIAPSWFDLDAVREFLVQRGMPVAPDASWAEIKAQLSNIGIESKADLKDCDDCVVKSQLYYVSSRYLLPASLILLCLSIDLKGIINLGPKALIMFFAATLGIIIGGPIALWATLSILPEGIFSATPDDIWRGLSTIAGSWIGGGANQTAMKEIYMVAEETDLIKQNFYDNFFGTMIVIDVIVANIWMGFLLYGANISDRVDRWLKADNSAIEDLKERVSNYQASIAQMPTLTTTFIVLGIAFGGVGIAHWGADILTVFMKNFEDALVKLRLNSLMSHFFWLIVISTTLGVGLSFTKMRKYEGVGASRFGSLFIYILVATIGMKMNIGEIQENIGLFVVGIIWMLVHVGILLTVAKLIKAPFFFVAVGSQANVGGAASAPIVASAFSPALAPVGVLMAVLGYALGTYGAIICAMLMQGVAL